MGELLDLEAIKQKWLNVCAIHDAGLSYPCNCPDGDYRPVMLDLVCELERLRREAVADVA